MAIELRSFNQWVSDQTDYDQDNTAFVQELNAITDPVKRDQFIRLNSTVAIKLFYWGVDQEVNLSGKSPPDL